MLTLYHFDRYAATAKRVTAMQRRRSTSTQVCLQAVPFMTVIVLCLAHAMQATCVCTEDPAALNLVGVGATLPQKVYEVCFSSCTKRILVFVLSVSFSLYKNPERFHASVWTSCYTP